MDKVTLKDHIFDLFPDGPESFSSDGRHKCGSDSKLSGLITLPAGAKKWILPDLHVDVYVSPAGK